MSAHLKLSFRRMGAEVEFAQVRNRTQFVIDIMNSKEGEKFLISGRDLGCEDIKILDVEPENKHLLLMWRERETGIKHKFLCGRDERHLFVAAIPDNPNKGKTGTYGVKNVSDAMEALKPEKVKEREHQVGVKGEARRERHNAARKRQGEWFFVPVWNPISLKNSPVLKNEPINRGGGKPHMCEYLVRDGGTRVHVCKEFPNGLEEKAYRKLISRKPEAKRYFWTIRVADAKVYVHGKISHADHATLDLGPGWHEVLMNRENEASGASKHMRFLD